MKVQFIFLPLPRIKQETYMLLGINQEKYLSSRANHNPMKNFILLLFLFFFCSTSNYANEIIQIGKFSQSDKSNWENHSFEGHTNYSLVENGNVTVLKAESRASASGLINRTRIDLAKTPFLNWRWKVDKSLYRLAETLKEGDDFAARIYIIVDGGVFFWKTLALNYVWSSSQSINALWDNPFTSNAKMIAVQTGNKNSNQWQTEKKNVREDFRRAYGKDIRIIDAIAIMTDTDNSGQKATAYYGDIYFSKN